MYTRLSRKEEYKRELWTQSRLLSVLDTDVLKCLIRWQVSSHPFVFKSEEHSPYSVEKALHFHPVSVYSSKGSASRIRAVLNLGYGIG